MSIPEIAAGCQPTEEMYCVHLFVLLLRSLRTAIKSCCGLAGESHHFLLSSVNNSRERLFGPELCFLEVKYIWPQTTHPG